jgi:integrase
MFMKRQLKWEGVDVTVHGFRSTLRDWMRGETNYEGWLWDMQVGHALGNKVSEAYGHDPQTKKRRRMMEEWGRYCSQPSPEPRGAKSKVGAAVINIHHHKRSA